MKTKLSMSVRHLSGVPLLSENGQPIDIVPYTRFKENGEGVLEFNVVHHTGYWNIKDHCEAVSDNVFRITTLEGEDLLVTPDWD